MEVPAPVLTGLVALLVVAALAIAYLAGRHSARNEPRAERADAARTGDPSETAGAGAASESLAPPTDAGRVLPAADGGDEPRTDPGVAANPWGDFDTPAAESPPGLQDTTGDPRIRSYFEQVEALESQAKYWDDPQTLAMGLVGQLGNGDTSGFDRLVDSQRSVATALRGIDVPPACREHHARTLSLVERGTELLERLRDAAAAGDAGSLVDLPAQARQLADQAREVDALADTIRREHGLGG